MAELSKSGTPSYSSVTPPQSDSIVGLIAGEDIGEADACYVKAADGLVYKATGAAATAPALVSGFSFTAAYTGDPVTLMTNGNYRYGAGLTPQARYYLSGAVAGGLADAASTGGTKAIAYAIDATRIRILPGGLM